MNETSPPPDGQKGGYFNNLINVRQEPLVSGATEKALKRMSEAKADDVQTVASSQIEILSRFYDLSLSQAGRSFRWALIASVVGLLFFLLAIVFFIWQRSGELSVITLLSGAMIEFIAGINFFLYGKTLSQLNLFQGKLEVTQRFLLANSLAESLGPDWKDRTRAELINHLANVRPTSPSEPERGWPERRRRNNDHDTAENLNAADGTPLGP